MNAIPFIDRKIATPRCGPVRLRVYRLPNLIVGILSEELDAKGNRLNKAERIISAVANEIWERARLELTRAPGVDIQDFNLRIEHYQKHPGDDTFAHVVLYKERPAAWRPLTADAVRSLTLDNTLGREGKALDRRRNRAILHRPEGALS